MNMTTIDMTTFEAVNRFNVAYAACIDEDALESWPEFFTGDCFYKITTIENHLKNMPAGLVYADSKGMLHDRISALREANVYEQHRYRHIIGMPLIEQETDEAIRAETAFLVTRIMRGGRMDLFATGKYVDEFRREGDRLLLRKRIVVCDSVSVDTLLAIPL